MQGTSEYVTGIDHVQLAAPPGCEARCRHFFQDVLRLTEIPKPPELVARGGVWFACGPQQLHIGVEPSFAPAKKAHPALRAHQFDDLLARLQAVGVDVRRDDLPERQRAFIEDPFGNRLELVASD
ncbi:MAG: glyoxalase [Firmicutes bacterium]|nr:glyoxalase [Bacillota bacterium]